MQKVRRAGYLLALIVGVALACAFAWRPAPPPKFTGLSAIPVPQQMPVDGSGSGSYQGHSVTVDKMTLGALASAQVKAMEYRQVSSGRVMELTLIGGTDRSALHDPRSCLVGAGWKIQSDHVEQIAGAGGTVPARTCLATIADPSAPGGMAGYDIMYLYVTHRHVIASATQIRLALLESALLDQSDAPIYFIRIMTPLPPGVGAMASPAQSQSYASEHAALTAFASALWRQVSASMLKGQSA